MLPEEIREIRLNLGLTQTEAGKLLGGGPRAFSKYEAGVVEPSAGLVKLLQILDREPSALSAISDRPPEHITSVRGTPFSVTGADVLRINAIALPDLFRSLLQAEASEYGLPTDDIHVAEQIYAPDGGEDAHIRWFDGPDRTSQLPNRYIQFQLKTTPMTPAKASSELLTSRGTLKPMVLSALEDNAHYILVSTSPLTAQQAKKMVEKIHQTLVTVGMNLPGERIQVWDGDQLASWINKYPAIATCVKEQTQSVSLGPFRSWFQWANRSEHTFSPFVPDGRLNILKTHLLSNLAKPGSIARISGPKGIGKSRLVLEILNSTVNGLSIRDLVLFADQAEAKPAAIFDSVQSLVNTSARAVIVINNCMSDMRRRLVNMAESRNSRISLATIDDDEYSATSDQVDRFFVDLAPDSVSASIIDRELPNLPREDRSRLILFSQGYPAIATLVAKSWYKNDSILNVTEDEFVDAFVAKPNDPNRDQTIRSAMLLATFGIVRHTDDESDSLELAEWGDMHPDQMHAALQRLIKRGIAQRCGRDIVLQPRPIAMRLTERQWNTWHPNKTKGLFTGTLRASFKENAARQLRWINNSEIARRIAKLYLQPGGPLDGLDTLTQIGHPEVLMFLSEINATGATEYIQRTFNNVHDLTLLSTKVRRALVHTLEKVAFDREVFYEAAMLMLRLAEQETEPEISNNATGQFAALFPAHGGATAADGTARRKFLDDVIGSTVPQRRMVVAKALLAGANTFFVIRRVGPEIHGSRPALFPWQPETKEEALAYVKFCVESIVGEAMADDEIGEMVRSDLGHKLRSLVAFGLIDTVESVVRHIYRVRKEWPAAIDSLGGVLRFDTACTSPELVNRVRRLLMMLQPQTLADRLHALVKNMPWDYPTDEDLNYEEQVKRQNEVILEISREALGNTSILAKHIPQLCKGTQRHAALFGKLIAENIPAPEDWLHAIISEVCCLKNSDRNFDLLNGFLEGLSTRAPYEIIKFKYEATSSRILAADLPALCARLGITSIDIQLVVKALKSDIIQPQSLLPWGRGDALGALQSQTLKTLFTELMHSRHGFDGRAIVFNLLSMHAHGASSRLENYRPELLNLASSVFDYEMTAINPMISNDAQRVFGWLLNEGRNDSDACTLALILCRAVAESHDSEVRVNLIAPLFPVLLSDFAEISWPLLGKRLLEPTHESWFLRNALTGFRAPLKENKRYPVLYLPADSLFAWCSAYPDQAPRCAVQMLPFLASDDPDAQGEGLHPLFRRLIDEFGDVDGVLDSTRTQVLYNFQWIGSLTIYFSRYLHPLSTLEQHDNPRVARWATRLRRQVEGEIEKERSNDDETSARYEI